MQNRMGSDDSCRLMLRNVSKDEVCCNTTDYSMKEEQLSAIQTIVFSRVCTCRDMCGCKLMFFVLLTCCVLVEEVIKLGLKLVCSVDEKRSDSFLRGPAIKNKKKKMSKLREELPACRFGIQVSFRAHQRQDYE